MERIDVGFDLSFLFKALEGVDPINTKTHQP
jgi:hypothetical protein